MKFSLDDKTFQQLQKSIGYVPTYTSQTESETTHPKQGLFGDFVDSVQMGAWKGASDLARGVNAVIDSDWLGKVSEWAGRKADENFQTMSPEMQKALSESAFDGFDGETGEGKGVLNYHWWAGNFGAFLGSNLDAVATLGVGKLATTAIKQGGKMLTKEAAEEIGEAAIKEATKRGIPERYKTAIGYSAVMGAMSAGSRDNQIRDELSAWNDDQFAESEQFRNDYYQLRESQDTQNLSDIEVFDLTKERFIDKAAKDAALDPVAMATDFSVGLFSGIGGGYKGILAPSQTVGKGVLKGMGIEGSTEALQGVAEQYALNDTAQQLYDHGRPLSENMGKAAAEGAVLGAAFGGVFGGIDGFGEKRRVANIQATKTGIPEIDASLEAHAEAMNQQLSSLTETLYKSHSPRKTMQEKMATFNQKYNQTTEPETLEGQQAVTSVQNLDINNNDTRHSFAGMNAQNADNAALVKAMDRAENGVNPEEIRKQTGWFQGADGKWRFEVMEDPKLITPHQAYEDFQWKTEYNQNELKTRLGEVWKDKRLFEAYPHLANLNVTIKPLNGDAQGYFDPTTREIVLSSHLGESSMRSALVHEVQHVIQARERFLNGSGLDIEKARLKGNQTGNASVDKEIAKLEQALSQTQDPNQIAEIQASIESYKELVAENNYQRIAGEVEARNAQTRLNMTEEERQARSPESTEDIPRHNQILRDYQGERAFTRHSFAGMNAKTADHSLLEQAKQAMENGVNPEEIRKQTGWFKGVDERWRLEINDRELSLNLDKFKQSENKGRVAQGYFSDLIKHDKLLSAYPDLESLYINIEISPNVMGDGRYSPRYQVDFGGGDLQWAAEEIIVKAKNYEEARKTLVHELQHAIQYRENFARGGTLSARNELIAANEQTIENLSDKVNYLKKQEIISPEDRAVIDEYHNAQKELEKLNNVSDELLYWNLAGEVEARLVSHRINLPDAGRRRIEPFIQESVPREQQVLRFHDGINHQLNEDFSSDFVKAIDVIAQGGTVATQIIDVGMTPNVLKMLGLPDANVIISSAVLHKVMLGKHNVTPETLKQLPKQINDPVAVMKSSTKDNGYVVLTELTESVNGVDKPIVAALHLKRSSLGLELINIASVYGRNNSQIQRGLENDLLYLNKEKGAKLSDNLTLQLRSPLSENSSISNDIKTETDLSQYQNQPKSQTFEFTAEKFHIANAVGKALSQHFEVMHSSELGIDDPAIEAAYNQRTGKIVIIANNIRANSILSREERLKWVAWHELAHRGLQVRFGKDFRALLENVDRNKAVNQLATAIQAQRLETKDNRLLAVEEALAELHAAYTTGKLEELESRYNINISKLNKAGFPSWFEMTVENIRNFFAKLFGAERVKAFSHQELLRLLTDIKRNAGGEINQQNGDVKRSLSETDLERQFIQTAKEYGGEEAYNQAKAEGKTELTYRQWVQVRTPEFKAWFGDWENDPDSASKVINPRTEEPLVVYHGTNSDFSVFDTYYLGDETYTNASGTAAAMTAGVGYWFSSENLHETIGYGSKSIPVFLNIKEPNELPSLYSLINQLDDYVPVDNDGNLMDSPYHFDDTSDITKYAQDYTDNQRNYGIDGLIIEDDNEFGGSSYVAFDANQIKSATDNVGSFDPKNDDIRFSKYANERDKMARAFKSIGAEVYEDSSRISESEYLTIEFPEVLDQLGYPVSIKIRFSNHALPDRYSQPDYDVIVGGTGHQNSHGSWVDVTKRIVERFGLKMPSVIKQVESRKNSKGVQKMEPKRRNVTKEERQIRADIKEYQELIDRFEKAGAKVEEDHPYRRVLNNRLERLNEILSSQKLQENADSIRYSRSAMDKLGLGKQETVTDKVKSMLAQNKDKSVSEWKQLFTGIGRKANAAIFDALAPLKYAEDAAGIRDSNESAYVAARLAAGSASITEASMLHGLPEFDEHGFVQRKQGTSNKDSLVGIMESLGGDVNAFLGWVAGNRAEQLFAEGRERNLDMADITYLKSLNKGKEEKFELARAKLQAWNNAALDLAEQSGLISAKIRASFGDNSFYIPFYRENDEGDPISPYRKSGLANQNSGIRKLKGSDKATSELLGNLISNATKLIDASVKNMAMNKAVINLADTEVISVIENPNMMDYKGIDKFKGDSGKTLVYIGGEQYLIEIHDKAVFNALTSINQKPIDYIGHKALIGAKRLLTATVTTMPDFMLRNILRDMAQAWTVDKNGFKLGIDSVNGFKKALNKSDSAIDLMFTGATFGTGYIDAGDPNVAAKKIRQHLRKNGLSESEQEGYMRSVIWSKDQLSKALDKYLAVGNAAENANRIAVYENALKAGKSRAQAALEAKDLMDFSMRGNASIIRWMGDVLPFFNARMQGLSQLGRSLRDNPRKVALRGAYIASASVMLAAMNVGNEAYESLPDEEKDNYWHIFLGEQHFRIPKPFEIGVIFGSMPERLFRTMSGQDPSGVFADRVYSALLNTFALNPIPQLGKPISELYFNRNTFTGSQIETMADQRLLPEARYNENTSLTARELGLLTGNSPKKIEHLVRGYFGTLGMYVLGMSDTVLRTGGNYGDAPTKHWHEMPLLGVLYRGNVNIPPRYTSQAKYFYDYVSEVNQIAATIKEYQDDGRIQDAKTLQKENAALLRFKPTLDDASKQLRQLKAKIDLIMSSPSLTSEQKQRRIENLAEKRNALQRAVVERVNREDF